MGGSELVTLSASCLDPRQKLFPEDP